VVNNSKGKYGMFVCKNCHDAGHSYAPLSTDKVNQMLSMTLRTQLVGVNSTNARDDDSLDDMLNSDVNDFTVTNQLKLTSDKLQCTNIVDEMECALALFQLEEGIDDLPETFSPLLLTVREDCPVLTEARRLLGWAGGFSMAPTHTAWQAYVASLVQCRQLAHASTHIIDLVPELKKFVSKALVYLMLKTDLVVAQVGQMASTLSEPAQVRLGEVQFDLSMATFCNKAPTLLGQKLAAFQSSLHPPNAVEETAHFSRLD